ncbi:MAG: class I SAM-dependent methyltransferase [Theionarchaea archaeon]|nr:class I SAM-dependent methyltransferase [Theionarchaea archaeon]
MSRRLKEDLLEGFDRLYESSKCVWGLEADKYLAIFLDKAPTGTALDVGCGEGRHSLFLAQNGYVVDAIDVSEVAIRKLKHFAEEYGVSKLVFPRAADTRKIDLPKQKYNLAVLSYVFPFLKFSDIITILTKVKRSLKPFGCIYVSALTVDDPEYKNYSMEQDPVEPRTFYSQELKCYCYYFDKGELKTLFSDFHIIDYTEAVVELAREPYTHAMCLIFAQKR